MKILLMKKDGIVHKVSALDKQKVQDKLDAGFVEVGHENLEPAEDIADAVKVAIEAFDINGLIEKAVAEALAKTKKEEPEPATPKK